MTVEISTVVSGMQADLIATYPATDQRLVFEVKTTSGKPSFTTLGQVTRVRDAVLMQDPNSDQSKTMSIFITSQELEPDLERYAEKLDIHVIKSDGSGNVAEVVKEALGTIQERLN
jgi:hypothetical protein